MGPLEVGLGVPRPAFRLRRHGLFPGVHETLHWGYEDPAAAEGTEEERLAVFRRVLIGLGERIQTFITLALKEATLSES